MKKLVFFLLITLVSLPLKAQFALKGGILIADRDISSYVVTGQFYKELLVLSGDLYVPTLNSENLSGGGRIGLGFRGDRFRFSADIGATYGDNEWRCGCGVEANLRLCGPIGIFGRWSRTFPIVKRREHQEILWDRGRSEVTIGVTFDF